jgi:heterodisulfide reductase subunit C
MAQRNEERPNSSAFYREIVRRLGVARALRARACYQCGTCASSCPVAKITSSFNPREIMLLALRAEKDELISGDAIWLCCSCFNCQERCPQKVEIADCIYALRNIAFKEGYIPNIYSEFASALLNDGRIVGVSKFVEKKRPALGLPPLQPTGVDALRRILFATGFDKLEQKKEEAK